MGKGRHRASNVTTAGDAGTVYLIHFDYPVQARPALHRVGERPGKAGR